MSNYLAQVAARNTGSDQLLLMPAHSPVEAGLDDPFDRVSFAADETGRATEVVPAAPQKPSADNAAIAEPAPPVKEKMADATPPMEIKPVYLSKYIDRNHYATREHAHQVVTESQGRKEVVRTEVEHPVSPILPAGESRPANQEQGQQITSSEKINAVQQKNRGNRELTPKQKSNVSKRPATIEERSTVILPVAATTANNNKHVLLQPQPPQQPHANPQKEKPVPALVIGKITVEIVPAQKPVNKIINHVVKPQPAASASVYRSKNSFGLGQL
jgi:hypothetical protein